MENSRGGQVLAQFYDGQNKTRLIKPESCKKKWEWIFVGFGYDIDFVVKENRVFLKLMCKKTLVAFI